MMFEIADDEALVLFEFLAREIDGRKAERLAAAMEHPSEFWGFNALHSGLERMLSQPFASNYRELVAAARERIIAKRDPDGTFSWRGKLEQDDF